MISAAQHAAEFMSIMLTYFLVTVTSLEVLYSRAMVPIGLPFEISRSRTEWPASLRERSPHQAIIPLIKSRNRPIQTFPKPARRQ
jgi:hypothetical protein